MLVRSEMSITTFDKEDIVTGSVIEQSESALLAPHAALSNMGSITYESSQKQGGAIIQFNE